MLGGFDPFLHTHVGGLDTVINDTTAGWEVIRVRVSPAAMARARHASNAHMTRFGTVPRCLSFLLALNQVLSSSACQ